MAGRLDLEPEFVCCFSNIGFSSVVFEGWIEGKLSSSLV